MNVQSLVEDAIFKSMQDRQFQPKVNAGYQTTALVFLNNILDGWRDIIPYGAEITFNNVNDLLSTTFVEVDTVQYVIVTSENSNAAFYLKSLSESEFKRQQVIIGLSAFPNVYYFNQLTQYIQIYPAPSQTNYQFIVRGRVAQISLGLFDNIPANMPRFMQDTLVYEIAFRLCAEYGVEWDSKKEDIRQSLLAALENKKEIDLSPNTDIVFGSPGISEKAPFPTWYYISGGSS